MLRFLTAGESHGPGLVTIVEGLPKGLEVSASDFAHELSRRRQGYGRGGRMKIETDELEILAGIRHGRTLGSPVAVVVRNSEWAKWSEVMGVEPAAPGKTVTRPRPGHVDLAGMLKYGTDDARDVLERASARETAARTIAGVLALKLIGSAGGVVVSHVVAIGDVQYEGPPPGPSQLSEVDASEVRCLSPEATRRMIAAIDQARNARDTLGGKFEVIAYDVPPGIGSHVHYDRRLDGMIASALMSIPAIKGVEVGDGFSSAGLPGSKAHDEILRKSGSVGRGSNRAGGIEGGISNGEPIWARAAMKPIPTLMQPLQTIDMATGEEAQAMRERADVCAVPAAAVVGEHMIAVTIAAEMQRKFGGDTVEEFKNAVDRHSREIAARDTVTRIWLIGLSGSGKSTTGRRAAEIVGVDFIDTDDLVVERTGVSIAELWADGGESLFRDHEAAVIRGLGEAKGIVAGGGGSILDPRSRPIVRESDQIIWLEATPEVITERIEAEGRPLFQGETGVLQLVEVMLQRRSPVYRGLATIRIDTSPLDVESVATQIAQAWNA